MCFFNVKVYCIYLGVKANLKKADLPLMARMRIVRVARRQRGMCPVP